MPIMRGLSAKVRDMEHVVILVHGIRDFARWQAHVRPVLECAGFCVVPLITAG